MAVREGLIVFFRWTVYARFPLFFLFLVFVILDMAPPILLLFGAFDVGCAIWTEIALKREKAA